MLGPSAPQRQGEGGAQAGVVHLEVEGAVVDGPLGLIDVPPDQDGAGGGVADAAAAVAEEGAQPGQVRQLKRVKIQHTFKSFVPCRPLPDWWRKRCFIPLYPTTAHNTSP